MSEFRLEYSFEETVKKMTEEVQRKVDQEILDANAHVLEEFGYVKVVRCRDCAYSIHFFHHDDERWQCTEPYQDGDDVKPDAYCWRGKRKEGGDD